MNTTPAVLNVSVTAILDEPHHQDMDDYRLEILAGTPVEPLRTEGDETLVRLRNGTEVWIETQYVT